MTDAPSPYEAPKTETGDARPAVILWYRIYASMIAFVSLLAVASSAWLLIKIGDVALFDPATGQTLPGTGVDKAMLVTMIVAGVFFGGLHTIAALVPYKPWGWVMGIVTIGLGVTGCTVVFAAPLLFYWIKPTTKAAFQRL